MAVALAPARLENGAVLSRAEFHALYLQCEDLHRVELIEGVVYLPSPISFAGHGREQTLALSWLDAYSSAHTGVEHSGPATLLLDDDNEPEPDAMLFYVTPDRLDERGYIVGPPELIVEIANTSVSRDLHQKKRAYERAGVLEYIVWRTADRAIDWFQLREGRYERREPGPDGIIESEVFPGLRLDVAAMLRYDRAAVVAALG